METGTAHSGTGFSATAGAFAGIGTAAGGTMREAAAIEAVCLGPGSRAGSLRATVAGRETVEAGACAVSIGFTLFQLS